jgi:hypothetical protein
MTAPDVIDAHPAADDERHQVVTALFHAFSDDRIYRWMVPDNAQRRRSAAIFYARFVEACWPHGQVWHRPQLTYAPQSWPTAVTDSRTPSASSTSTASWTIRSNA